MFKLIFHIADFHRGNSAPNCRQDQLFRYMLLLQPFISTVFLFVLYEVFLHATDHANSFLKFSSSSSGSL